jgi:hypothetical protein
LLQHADTLAAADGQAPRVVLPGRCVPYVIDRADLFDSYRSSVHAEEATAYRLTFWGWCLGNVPSPVRLAQHKAL